MADYNNTATAVDEDGEEVPAQIAELANSAVPSGMRGIRACKRCGILKTLDQFLNEGCENCPFLDMVRSFVGSFVGSLLLYLNAHGMLN